MAIFFYGIVAFFLACAVVAAIHTLRLKSIGNDEEALQNRYGTDPLTLAVKKIEYETRFYKFGTCTLTLFAASALAGSAILMRNGEWVIAFAMLGLFIALMKESIQLLVKFRNMGRMA